MNAKKCDRCGSLYERNIANPGITVCTTTIDFGEFRLDRVDLCPSCQTQLKDWFRNCDTRMDEVEE